MVKNATGKGGMRPGAGRPSKDVEDRLVKLGVALSVQHVAYIDLLCAQNDGMTRSEAIRMLVHIHMSPSKKGPAACK